MLKRFLDHIELWLSGAGLLVVWLASIIAAPGGTDLWMVAAVTALVVSVLHGVIFYAVRRRQRRVRDEAIADIREMLADQVGNQLAVMGMWFQDEEMRRAYEQEVAGINHAIAEISDHISDLTDDSLTSWKVRYSEAVENATDLRPAMA